MDSLCNDDVGDQEENKGRPLTVQNRERAHDIAKPNHSTVIVLPKCMRP